MGRAADATRHARHASGRCNLCLEMTEADMSELPPEIDTSRPHPARMYDYYLGGKNHFAADREVAEKVAGQRALGTHRGAREPGVPRPRGPVPGGGGGHQAVPRHRHRAADHEQRARGRAGGRARPPASSTSTTTRWCSRTRGRCSPPRRRAAPPTSTPTCATRRDPVHAGRPGGARLQPAGRAHARAASCTSSRTRTSPSEIIATLLDALPPGSYLVASHLNRGT